jgi:acetylornithine deacetylase/succinyl-diaminopimelate desuccinylase family protein
MISKEIINNVLKNVNESYAIELTRKLIKIPSVCMERQYKEITEFVYNELKSYGVEVKIESEKSLEWERPNVIGIIKGRERKPRLMYAAHTDTVPLYQEKWSVDPLAAVIINGKIYGRGAADTKGSLAAMMAAMKAIIDSDIELKGDLVLVAWYGDEWPEAFTAAKFFNGLSYIGHNQIVTADYAVLGEPYDLKICPAARGRVWLYFKVRGKATHSATGKGINAILKSIKLIESIYKELRLGEDPLLGRDTINVGVINCGTQPNIVPDLCEIKFDIRFGRHLTTSEVIKRVDELIDKLRREDPEFIVEMSIPEKREPTSFPEDGELVRSLLNAGKLIDTELQLGGAVSFGDILEWRDKMGLKEAVLFGPGKTEMAHAIDEHIEIKDLLIATKVLAVAPLLLLGVHEKR